MLLGMGISIGLGAYSYFKLEPKPTIDKSIKAFNIPNHIASRRHDALDVAISDMRNRYRGRRDLRHFYEDSHYKKFYSPGKNVHFSEANIHSQHSFHGEDTIDVFVGNKHAPQIKSIPESHLRKHVSKMVDKIFTEGEEEEKHLQDGTHLQNSYSRHKRAFASDGRIYGITLGRRRWKMQIVYIAQGEDEKNIFTEERISTVHDIERKIQGHPGYTDFCYISYYKWKIDTNLDRYGGCIPLNSLLTYFYPSKTKDGMVHYDGLGSNMDQIDRTLTFAMTRSTFFWYVDDKINATHKKSNILRTEVPFGAPLPGMFIFMINNIIS